MPAWEFAPTFEQLPVFEKVGSWAGGALAGVFIGLGLGLPAVEAKEAAREAGKTIACNIATEYECDTYLSEELGHLPEATAAGIPAIALGGLVAVTVGLKRRAQTGE